MAQIMTEPRQTLPLETNGVAYQSYQFGDNDFIVPPRYINLFPRGIGAQGAVW